MSDASTPKPDAKAEDQKSDGQTRLHEVVQFEQMELWLNGVVAVLIGNALVFLGVFLISAWILKSNKGDVDQAATAPNYSLPAEPKPSGPRLEPLDYETAVASNVFAAQLEKEHVLHTYGTTSEENYIRIPIEKAMKLTSKAMPLRQGGIDVPAKSFGLLGGGESNSGRKYSEAPSWLEPKK
jgi:hypothetical protein